MSLNHRKAFFRTRAGKSDANSQTIIDGLRGLGYFVVPIRASDPGVSDIAVLVRTENTFKRPWNEVASWLWLELKTAKGKLRESQVEWQDRAKLRGAMVASAKTLDEALAALGEAWKRVWNGGPMGEEHPIGYVEADPAPGATNGAKTGRGRTRSAVVKYRPDTEDT